MTVEQAKKVLRDNGFFVDNLWHVDDVKKDFWCTDEQAQAILDGALTNEATMEQVWDAIDLFAEVEDLERKDYSEEF